MSFPRSGFFFARKSPRVNDMIRETLYAKRLQTASWLSSVTMLWI